MSEDTDNGDETYNEDENPEGDDDEENEDGSQENDGDEDDEDNEEGDDDGEQQDDDEEGESRGDENQSNQDDQNSQISQEYASKGQSRGKDKQGDNYYLGANRQSPLSPRKQVSFGSYPPRVDDLCKEVESLSSNVDHLINNFSCISGRGVGSFSRLQNSGTHFGGARYGNHLSAYGSHYGSASPNFSQIPLAYSHAPYGSIGGGLYQSTNYYRHQQQPSYDRAGQHLQHPQQQHASLILPTDRLSVPHAHGSMPGAQNSVSPPTAGAVNASGAQNSPDAKEDALKEAYREAYKNAYSDIMRESQQMRERVHNEVMGKVAQKRRELLDSAEQNDDQQQQQQYEGAPTEGDALGNKKSANALEKETEKLRASYEQQKLADLEKMLEKKKRRDKYKLREDSQKIIDNYYKNLYRPNLRSREENGNEYYRNLYNAETMKNSAVHQQERQRKNEDRFLRQYN